MQNQAKGGLTLGSNPFAFSQQKNGVKGQNNGTARLFSTPFNDSAVDTTKFTQQNTAGQDSYDQQLNGSHQQQNILFEKNTLGYNINNNQPDGGPGAHNRLRQQQNIQHQNQNFIKNQHQQQQVKQTPFTPVTQNQYHEEEDQHIEFVADPPANHSFGQNGFSHNDESISLDEIQTDNSDFTYQKQSNQRMPQNQQLNRGGHHQQQAFKTPFRQDPASQQQQDPKLEKSESGKVDEEEEISLLEDLEIDLDRIKAKLISVITQRGIKENADYDDMSGPILVCILFGFLLLLKGKVQFGYIYGFGLTGCLGIYFIINLLSKRGQYVELYKTTSILGYSLMPFVLLALTSVFVELSNIIGGVLSLAMIIWSTTTATRYFEYGLDMEDKKYLIAYPISLFYFVFMLLTVF
ncbi:UNKNOWN [Stylonychia lemnae]|uniref:Yip1 domain-containing protein n=1 Tax=Stylonychia lemnae TaxID=5949 RepID=A0A078A2R4_STYLE|nr:UNKNOWN [Stylonychia lemnae]|eukprot:CDW76117.1 UNKNOWN [Stylonychia lemnae]